MTKGVMYGEIVDDIVPGWLKEFKQRPSYRVVKGVVRTIISFLVILCARSISDEAMTFVNNTIQKGDKNSMLHLLIVLAISYNSSEDLRIMMIVGIIYLIIKLTVLKKPKPKTTTSVVSEPTNKKDVTHDHIAANHMINDNNEYWDSSS